MTEPSTSLISALERGVAALQKVSKQDLLMSREDAVDLINLETVVKHLIENARAASTKGVDNTEGQESR